MNKEELLGLLDDAAVQQKIIEIVSGENFQPESNLRDDTGEFSQPESNLRDATGEKIAQLESEVMLYEQRLIDASNKISALESNLRDATNQAQNLRVENYQLKTDLSKAAQREKNYQSEADELENRLAESKRREKNYLAEIDRLKENLLKCEQREKNYQAKINNLEESYAAMQQKFAAFERGWQLFQDYQNVGLRARQILDTGVFPHNNFVAFICGGAQPNSLEIIWDVVRECALRGDNSDAKILWQIFEFCIELVNSARAQASYSILPVKVGDRFDSDFQLEGPNSRAQGTVAAVYLRGFKNNYNDRVIRKSIVQVS